MTATEHPLWEALKACGHLDIDSDFIRERGDQERAFDYCVEFLKRVKRTRHVNTRSGHNYSGHIKHLIESPSRHLPESFKEKNDLHDCPNIYTTYVYKGTLYLAARCMGFRCKRDPMYPKSINVNFNIAKRGFHEATLDFINYVRNKQLS